MTESEIQAAILKKLGARSDVRLFRNNTGVAYQGKRIRRTADTITLKNPRRIRFGLCVGSSDIIGIVQHHGHGVFLAIEVKSARGRLSVEQNDFLYMVQRMGGIAFVARSVAEAERKLEEALVR